MSMQKCNDFTWDCVSLIAVVPNRQDLMKKNNPKGFMVDFPACDSLAFGGVKLKKKHV